MYKSVRILAIIAALVFLAAVTSRSASVDPNLPDTVSIDSVSTFASGVGIVPVRLFNDEKLATAEVTLALSSSSVKIDSFSFVGGRVESAPIRGFLLNADSSIVAMYFDIGSSAPIAVGTGLMGNLYLHWTKPITPQVITIDSVSWINEVNVLHTTVFIDSAGQDFTPHVRKGYLNIRPDPSRPDSLWIVSAEANTGGQVTINVGSFNEAAIQNISLALTWSSNRLNFDSLTYSGTRGDAAPSKGLQTNNSAKELLATIFYDASSPLPAGSGILAHLYFSVPANAPETTITIDSTTFLGTQGTYLTLTAADGSTQFTPIFHSGTVTIKAGTGVNDGGRTGLPKTFSLGQNYPNPFNPTTEIQFDLPRTSEVRLEVYNILGARVRTLVDRTMEAGYHRIEFDGKSESGQRLASGLYFYRISAADFVQTKKMTLLK